jgi:cell division septum initiation protein DivIVA
MAKKNITIDDLAKMIKEGFDKTATLEQLDNVEKDVAVIKRDITVLKNDVKEIKYDLKGTTKQADKLEVRVDYVENVLALKKN